MLQQVEGGESRAEATKQAGGLDSGDVRETKSLEMPALVTVSARSIKIQWSRKKRVTWPNHVREWLVLISSGKDYLKKEH